ncbi:MAG: hypothetical protein HY903_11245, partial [Deltaproteobacteria bacterium]|nr:hypothetical protein [Deltaproteobacteria bacterium]
GALAVAVVAVVGWELLRGRGGGNPPEQPRRAASEVGANPSAAAAKVPTPEPAAAPPPAAAALPDAEVLELRMVLSVAPLSVWSVVAPAGGVVARLEKHEGDAVERGEVLLSGEDPKGQQRRQAAERKVKSLEAMAKQSPDYEDFYLAAKKELDALKRKDGGWTVRAKEAGRILKVHKAVGASVKRGTKLVDGADVAQLLAVVPAGTVDANAVVGCEVQELEGAVPCRLATASETGSGTRVGLVIDNRGDAARPGDKVQFVVRRKK